MKLPAIIANLVQAQDHFDSVAYANCFSATAVVYDEGHTHTGKEEIRQWIEKANETYKAVMKPQAYTTSGKTAVLTAEVSGTFPGSPLAMQYHLEIENDLIQFLKITG